jgi:hypothetical protein
MNNKKILDLERRCLDVSSYRTGGAWQGVLNIVTILIVGAGGFFISLWKLKGSPDHVHALFAVGAAAITAISWRLSRRRERKMLIQDADTVVCRDGQTLSVARGTDTITIAVEDIQFVQWCNGANRSTADKEQVGPPYTIIHFKPFNRVTVSPVIIRTRQELEDLLPDVEIRESNCEKYHLQEELVRKDALKKWLDKPL